MKKVIFTVIAVTYLATSGFSQFKFGAGGALLTDNSLLGVGAKAHYTITKDFAAQASFHLYFDTGSNYSLDLDVHYNGFGIGDVEGFQVIPFAGLNFLHNSINVDGIGRVSGSSTNLNIGVNGTLKLTEKLDLYIEPKFVIGGGSTFGIATGVYF